MKKQMINCFMVFMLTYIAYGCTENNAIDPVFADEVDLLLTEEGDEFSKGSVFAIGEVLNLTDEQKARIQEIVKAHRENFKPQRGQGQGSFEGRQAKRKEMRESLLQEISGVLTSEQIAKAEELKAQFEQGKFPEEIVNKQIEKMAENLNLSVDQQEQLKQLRQSHQFSRVQGNKGDRQQMRQKRMELRQEREEALKNILTAEQFEKLNEQGSRRKFGGRRGFSNRKGQFTDGRLAHLVDELELTSEQQDQIKEIFTSLREGFQGMSGSGEDFESRREAMQSKMAEIYTQVIAILSKEQTEKFEELKKQRKGKIRNRRP